MKKTIPIPASHCDAFRKATFRTSFSLNLSQPMIEMLCAVADGVMWDRSLYHSRSPIPDNWIASQQALEKRGLVRPATDAEREKDRTRKA